MSGNFCEAKLHWLLKSFQNLSQFWLAPIPRLFLHLKDTFTPKTFDQGWGKRLGCSWNVTKSVIKQKAKPSKFFLPICFLPFEYKKHQSRFFTRATALVSPKQVKWLIFHRSELHGTRLGFPSLPCWVFLTPTRTVYADGGRSVYRFPIFYSYGASLRARHSAKNVQNTLFLFLLYMKIFGDNNLPSGGRQFIFRRP